MSDIGTKRTSLFAPHMSAFGSKADIAMTQGGHSTRCLAPEPRPLTTPLSSEIASGLSRVFVLLPPHGEQQQREEQFG